MPSSFLKNLLKKKIRKVLLECKMYLVVVTLSRLKVGLDHRVLLEAPIEFRLLAQQVLEVGDGELILGECEEGHQAA